MDYQTYEPHLDLKSIISCYWTLEVQKQNNPQKQQIIPDGCIEMIFILGDNIKRYTSEKDFIIQARAIILGQITKPFYIEPTGIVKTFAVRFNPYGLVNFISEPISNLIDREIPINQLFETKIIHDLEQKIIQAQNTKERIVIIEKFLLSRLNDEQTINRIIEDTINSLISSNGCASILSITKNNLSKRRQLERIFKKQIGISPKQLGKVFRLQTTLKMLLEEKSKNLTDIAYKSGYFDQAHFIKDFKEFT